MGIDPLRCQTQPVPSRDSPAATPLLRPNPVPSPCPPIAILSTLNFHLWDSVPTQTS